MLDQLLWGHLSRDCNFSCSEYCHVAYQIKADDAGSNMVANILPTDTPSTQGVGSKGQTISFSERGWCQKVKLYHYLKVVMLHIKLKGIKHRAL